MEKQNNNKANNNIGVNNTKPPKKKMKTSTIVIIVLTVLLLFSCVGNIGNSGSSSPSSTAETTAVTEDKGSDETKEEAKVEEPEEQEAEPEKIEEVEIEPEEVIEGQANKDTHLHVGDEVAYTSGLILRIKDIGTYTAFGVDSPILYMELECENTSDESIRIYNSDLELYIDDYQYDVVPSVDGEDPAITYSVDVNPGRKMIFKPSAKLPGDYDSAEKIEISFTGWDADESIFVKKDGIYLWGRENVPTDNSNTISNNTENSNGLDSFWYEDDHPSMDGTDYVLRFEPDGWASAVVIIKADYEHQWLLFMEDERNGYLTYVEGDDKVGSIYFGMSGIEFKSDTSPELNGLYW